MIDVFFQRFEISLSSFRFVSMQSSFGQAMLQQYDLPRDMQSMILFDEESGNHWMKSEAALKIAVNDGDMFSFKHLLFSCV